MKIFSSFTNKACIICFFISFFALIVGLIPYLSIRTSSTHISSFLSLFFDFKKIPLNQNGLLYSLITSFFSDFCWDFAMPFSLFAFTRGKFSKYFYMLSTPIIGSALELLQFFGIIDGVGDIFDSLIYFTSSFLGYIIIERGILKWQTNHKKNHRKKKNHSPST